MTSETKPAVQTQAERFCAMDDDWAGAYADELGAEESYIEGGRCEVTFPDGSVASTTGGDWRPVALTKAEKDGRDERDLYFGDLPAGLVDGDGRDAEAEAIGARNRAAWAAR